METIAKFRDQLATQYNEEEDDYCEEDSLIMQNFLRPNRENSLKKAKQ